MRRLGRLLATALLITLVTAPAGALAQTSVSGTIEDPESGGLLDFTVLGGTITAAEPDGWDYSVEGTVRVGETISIAASGHGTTWTGRHHVNEDREASFDIWFEDSDVREHVTLPPGERGSLAASYVVPDDAWTVRGVVVISNAWINPYGGGSRTLTARIAMEVVGPETTTTETPTTAAPPVTQPSDDDDCASGDRVPNDNPIVRFGDLHGEVNVRQNCEDDDAYIFAELSTPLWHDDRIRTHPRSGAILSFSDMTSFVMREDSIIVLDIANERESKIGLVAGNIWVNLQRMIKDGSMEVEMGQAVAGIKGTIFIAEETGSASTVKVFEGVVEMRPNVGEPVLVGAGTMLQVTAEGAGPVADFDMAAELASWDETVQRATTDALRDDGSDGPPVVVVGALIAVLAGAFLGLGALHRRTQVPRDVPL